MKKTINAVFAIIVLLCMGLFSCTGGVESMTGGVTGWDRAASIGMILSSVIIIIGVIDFFKGKSLGEGTDRGASLVATSYIIMGVGALFLGGSAALYFWG